MCTSGPVLGPCICHPGRHLALFALQTPMSSRQLNNYKTHRGPLLAPQQRTDRETVSETLTERSPATFESHPPHLCPGPTRSLLWQKVIPAIVQRIVFIRMRDPTVQLDRVAVLHEFFENSHPSVTENLQADETLFAAHSLE